MTKLEKILSAAVVALCAALLACVFVIFKLWQAQPPVKVENLPDGTSEQPLLMEIEIEVIGSDGKSTLYELSTDAKYLSQAMEEADGLTFEGTDGMYGLMLEKVNGEQAIYEQDGAYWSILVDGEYGMYGIDSQPVEDGVRYSLVYTLA